MEEVKYFNANHPFMFMIYHKINEEILFMGKVYNPLVAENNFLMNFYKNSNEKEVDNNYNVIEKVGIYLQITRIIYLCLLLSIFY